MGLFKELIKSKDKIISEIGKKYLASKIVDYGSVDTFFVSSSTKEVYAKLILKGDQEPVEIRIKNYSFDNINDEIYLTFEEIICSREWIDNLQIIIFINLQKIIESKFRKSIEVSLKWYCKFRLKYTRLG